ncbi:helix-turn-helix domain-containing protein, partial [Hungatella sp. SL.1.14]|uniref:helix-turn-helix domain-containing protein n=1 Tax=Hungatella sp. SL.1.14 TaxID=2963703 RepID=UPI002109041F
AAEILTAQALGSCRLFKKYTGQTFLAYVNSVRTMNFYEDLLKSDESITQLMVQNGLTNYKVFMRIFKEMYGTTPQKIRKSMRVPSRHLQMRLLPALLH